MRFQRKEDLAKFYDNPFYLGVIKEHVSPYCHVRLTSKHQYSQLFTIFSP